MLVKRSYKQGSENDLFSAWPNYQFSREKLTSQRNIEKR